MEPCVLEATCIWLCGPSDIKAIVTRMRHGMGSFLVFVGLDGTKEELGLVSTNFWMYKDNDLDTL